MSEEISKDLKRAERRTRKGQKKHNLGKILLDDMDERLRRAKRGSKMPRRLKRLDAEEITYDEIDEILDEQEDFYDDLL